MKNKSEFNNKDTDTVNIEGLRVYRAIERFGSEETYFKILEIFVAGTPALLEMMSGVNERNLSEYAVAVHGLKGSSLNICADNLAARAEQLEIAAKNGEIEYIKKNNGKFINAVNELIDSISGMLRSVAARDRKPVLAEPDPYVLASLREACESFDIDGVDWAMSELDKYEYENDDLFEWLKEKVALMGFRHIVKRLDNIEDEMG